MRTGITRRVSLLEKPTVAKENKIPDYMVINIQKEDLKAAYSLYETAEESSISMGQAQSILWNFGFWRLSKKEFENELVSNQIDPKRETITYDEIVQIVTKKYNRGGKEGTVKEIFEIFDTKGKGSSSIAEIQQLFHKHLEIDIPDNEINDVFKEIGLFSESLTSQDFNTL